MTMTLITVYMYLCITLAAVAVFTATYASLLIIKTMRASKNGKRIEDYKELKKILKEWESTSPGHFSAQTELRSKFLMKAIEYVRNYKF